LRQRAEEAVGDARCAGRCEQRAQRGAARDEGAQSRLTDAAAPVVDVQKAQPGAGACEGAQHAVVHSAAASGVELVQLRAASREARQRGRAHGTASTHSEKLEARPATFAERVEHRVRGAGVAVRQVHDLQLRARVRQRDQAALRHPSPVVLNVQDGERRAPGRHGQQVILARPGAAVHLREAERGGWGEMGAGS
jgi:hypothetical protein